MDCRLSRSPLFAAVRPALLTVVWGLCATAAAQTDTIAYVKKDTIRATLEASAAAAQEQAVRLGPWRWIGPFENAFPKDLGKAVEQSHPIEKNLSSSVYWLGKGGADLRWQPAEALTDGQIHDLATLVPNPPYVLYLHRAIDSSGEYDLPLAIGNTGALIVRLNGQRIMHCRGTRQPRLGDHQLTLKLRKGKNDLLIKTAYGPGEPLLGLAALSVGETPRYQNLLLARIQQDFPGGEVQRFLLDLDLQRQWTQLEAQVRNRGQFAALAGQTLRQAAGIAESDRDPADVVLRRTEALISDLDTLDRRVGLVIDAGRMDHCRRVLGPARMELDNLKAQRDQIDVKDIPRRRSLYASACQLRRKVAFANPLLDFNRLLFIKRERNPNSEGTGHHMCDQFFGFNARNIPGGGVFVLEKPFSDVPAVTNVLAGATVENGTLSGKKLDFGAFLAPELSYDGRSVLFAHSQADTKARRWSEERSYHVFSVGLDGSHLRQLTHGAYNDFDPCFMPNGRIVFISERRGGFGRCHGRPVPVYTLHTMKDDGSDIVCISYHESNEWQPSINHDGMIVYTRWDYVDRHFNIAHHPWITTPDGRDARAIHGNFPPDGQWSRRPQMEMDIRAVPGSRKYIATTGAHHGQSYGSLVLFDPDGLDDGAMGPIRRITPEARFPESECDTRDQPYSSAWPLNEDYYLAVWDTASQNYGLYLVDSFGNKEFLYRDPGISCLSPIPIKPRPVPPLVPMLAQPPAQPLVPPVMASTSDEMRNLKQAPPYSIYDPDRGWARPYTPVPDPSELGEVLVVNVYEGSRPWPEGTQIKQIRIVETLIKSTPPADGPRISVGGQSAARAVLGTVPVQADGSVRFLAPIHRPLLFQAIDQHGMAVQSMRSDTYVMRGTRLVCRGCHEPANQSPIPPSGILALKSPPARITPDVDGTNPFSYPRLVQPVLDRHCADCHAKKKAIDLGRGTPEENAQRGGWFASYASLAQKYGFWYSNGAVSHNAFDGSGTTPGKFGAYGSPLYKILMAGHYDVKLPPEDLHRLTLWLENNSAFYGDYQDTAAQARGEEVRPVVE